MTEYYLDETTNRVWKVISGHAGLNQYYVYYYNSNTFPHLKSTWLMQIVHPLRHELTPITKEEAFIRIL